MNSSNNLISVKNSENSTHASRSLYSVLSSKKIKNITILIRQVKWKEVKEYIQNLNNNI